MAEVQETVYGLFSSSFREDLLRDVCVKDRGIQTGPFGSQLHQRDYVPIGTPIITVEHLGENRILHDDVPRVSDSDRDRLKRYKLKQGDIVFSRVGSVDRRALVRKAEEGWLFSGRCLRVRADADKIDPVFLSCFFGLETFKEHIRAIAVGATMPSLNTRLLSDVSIFYPPLEEQRAIADILGTLDDKIEQNRHTAQALERLARAIFRAWFVDFEPVKAKAAGAASFPSMPQHVFQALPTRFIDSAIGPVPEGWHSGLLGDIIDIHDSRRVPLSRREREQRKGSFRYYGATGIIDHVNDFLFDGVFVLVGEDGTVMNDQDRPVVQYVWGKFWVNNHAHVLTGSSGISTEHLRVLLDHINIRPFLTGAVQPKLNQRNLKSVPILIPPSVAVAAFDDVIAPLFACLRQIQDQSHVLESVRDLLRPQLLSGQIRVEAVDG